MKNLSIAGIVQFIILFSIFSSILYDLSYYMTLGINIKILPLDLTELLYDSIRWLPLAFISLLVGIVLGLGTTKVTGKPSSKNETKTMRYLILILGIILMLDYLYYGFERINDFWLALTIFSIAIYNFIETKVINNFLTSIPNEYKKLLSYIPIYIPFILFYASLNAQLSLNDMHNKSVVSFNDGSKDLNVTIIRSLNIGYLVKTNNKIKIIYSNQIKDITLTLAPHFNGFKNRQDMNKTKD